MAIKTKQNKPSFEVSPFEVFYHTEPYWFDLQGLKADIKWVARARKAHKEHSKELLREARELWRKEQKAYTKEGLEIDERAFSDLRRKRSTLYGRWHQAVSRTRISRRGLNLAKIPGVQEARVMYLSYGLARGKCYSELESRTRRCIWFGDLTDQVANAAWYNLKFAYWSDRGKGDNRKLFNKAVERWFLTTKEPFEMPNLSTPAFDERGPRRR